MFNPFPDDPQVPSERPPVTMADFLVYKKRILADLNVLQEALERDDGVVASLAANDLAFYAGFLPSPRVYEGQGVLQAVVGELLSKTARGKIVLFAHDLLEEAVPSKERFNIGMSLHGVDIPSNG